MRRKAEAETRAMRETGHVGMALLFFLFAAFPCFPADRFIIEVGGGFSYQAPYAYEDPLFAGPSAWVDFRAVNFPGALVKVGYKPSYLDYSLGLAFGFNRRFDLYLLERSPSGALSREMVGMVIAFPILAWIGGDTTPLFWTLGCGISFNRMNFDFPGLPESENSSIFTFLFGSGYSFGLGKALDLRVGFDLLACAPGVYFDLLPPQLKSRVSGGSTSSVLVYRDPAVIWNVQAGVSLRYSLGIR